GAKRVALGAARGGTDQHAITAGTVYFLDHQFRQMIQAIAQVVLLVQLVGRYVVENRLLGQIETDHLGHEGIDRLVVGDSGADRVGKRHLARPVGRKQSWHTEHRVRPERERIQKIVVDPAVDHVHPLRTACGAHENRVVLYE